ncbi:MAG: response regulator [Limimaricola sp.]|uniref:response regulator n=1 Tax=Limimaricola sp. TaxID=2211665 RepID=UPI001E03FEE5|nr:response regulator [Limimaricola sp.]MBI1418677.1 response regulator [Limimaricola sp.]
MGSATRVLVVESKADLAEGWVRHLQSLGVSVRWEAEADLAIRALEQERFHVILIDLMLSEGGALAVADYARFRHTGTNVIFVTDTTVFSDGSIFGLMPNVRAFLESHTPPDDLAAMVQHYARPI